MKTLRSRIFAAGSVGITDGLVVVKVVEARVGLKKLSLAWSGPMGNDLV